MKLRTRQIRATWKSAEKWLTKWGEWKTCNDIKIGAKHCPLCKEFNNKNIRDADKCINCPIAEDTGVLFCENTPYEDIEDLRWHYNIREEVTDEELEEFEQYFNVLYHEIFRNIEDMYQYLITLALKISNEEGNEV